MDVSSLLLEYLDAVDARTRAMFEGLVAADVDRIVDRRWDPPVVRHLRHWNEEISKGSPRGRFPGSRITGNGVVTVGAQPCCLTHCSAKISLLTPFHLKRSFREQWHQLRG